MKKFWKLRKMFVLALIVPIMPVFAKELSRISVTERLRKIENDGGIVLWTEKGDGIVVAKVCPECKGKWEELPSRAKCYPRCSTCGDRGNVITESGKALAKFYGEHLYVNPHPIIG